MFKQIDFTKTGGLYVYQETLDYLQQTYSQVLAAITANYGDKIILTGLTSTGGGNVSDGWVVLNGEILPVVGGAVLTYLHLDSLVTNEQFDDGNAKPVYTAKRLLFVSVVNDNYLWSDFKRLPLSISGTITDVLTNIQTVFNSLLFEASVILSGFAVTSVNTITLTCTIGAGTAYMGGKIVSVLARTGTYPCWLKQDGTYVTADPGGINIKFDSETSQRIKDVNRRNSYETGGLYFSNNFADLNYFDIATGTGKWKWYGWKLSDATRSRKIVGYDRRTVDPGDGVYDANYHSPGYTGTQTNAKTILQANLPNVQLDVPIPTSDTSTTDSPGDGRLTTGADSTAPVAGPTLKTDPLGSGTALDTRDPGVVLLIFERL